MLFYLATIHLKSPLSFLLVILFPFFLSRSSESDLGGSAGDDQGAGGRPTCGHRGPDQRDADAIRYQGELPDAGRVPGQL